MILILKILTIILCSTLISCISGWLFLKIPSSWLCEYDEIPTEIHEAPYRKDRLKHGISLMSFLYSLIFLFLLCKRDFQILYYELYEKELSDSGFSQVFASINGGYIGISLSVIILLILGIISLSDWKYRIIPDQLVLALLVLSCLRSAFDILDIKHAISGGLAAGGLILISFLLSYLFYGEDAIGFGDVKLMAVCGALAGQYGVLVFAISTIASALYFSIGLLLKRIKTNDTQPFAPWICIATALFLL